jgi:hypothetical protein
MAHVEIRLDRFMFLDTCRDSSRRRHSGASVHLVIPNYACRRLWAGVVQLHRPLSGERRRRRRRGLWPPRQLPSGVTHLSAGSAAGQEAWLTWSAGHGRRHHYGQHSASLHGALRLLLCPLRVCQRRTSHGRSACGGSAYTPAIHLDTTHPLKFCVDRSLVFKGRYTTNRINSN